MRFEEPMKQANDSLERPLQHKAKAEERRKFVNCLTDLEIVNPRRRKKLLCFASENTFLLANRRLSFHLQKYTMHRKEPPYNSKDT